MIATRSPCHHTHLFRVCWASIVDDCQGRGRPMVRDLAEFIAHDEELAHPMRRYWLEACDVAFEDDETEIEDAGR